MQAEVYKLIILSLDIFTLQDEDIASRSSSLVGANEYSKS